MELANVTQGNRDQITTLLTSVAKITDTLDTRDAQVRDLIDRADRLSAQLADKDKTLVALIDDSQGILTEIQRRRDDIAAGLNSGNAAVSELDRIISVDKSTIDGALTALHPILQTVSARQTDIDNTLASLGPGLYTQGLAVSHGPWADVFVKAIGPDLAGCINALDGNPSQNGPGTGRVPGSGNSAQGRPRPRRRLHHAGQQPDRREQAVTGRLRRVGSGRGGRRWPWSAFLPGCKIPGQQPGGGYTMTAYFPKAVSLYPKSSVRVLGPQRRHRDGGQDRRDSGRGQDVDGQVDRAAARASRPPSCPSRCSASATSSCTRPGCRASPGSTPPDKSQTVIGLDRTSIPVEPDEALAALKRLLDDLDPSATDGSSPTSTHDLSGNGQNLNDALKGLGTLTNTLGDKDKQLGDLIDNFAQFTTTLDTRESQLGTVMDLFAQTTISAGPGAGDHRQLDPQPERHRQQRPRPGQQARPAPRDRRQHPDPAAAVAGRQPGRGVPGAVVGPDSGRGPEPRQQVRSRSRPTTRPTTASTCASRRPADHPVPHRPRAAGICAPVRVSMSPGDRAGPDGAEPEAGGAGTESGCRGDPSRRRHRPTADPAGRPADHGRRRPMDALQNGLRQVASLPPSSQQRANAATVMLAFLTTWTRPTRSPSTPPPTRRSSPPWSGPAARRLPTRPSRSPPLRACPPPPPSRRAACPTCRTWPCRRCRR